MSIADDLRRVEERIANACARANRDPAEVTLVGVSKQKPAADIISAIEAGLRHIGENRVEEGISKMPQVMDATECALTWHMVGHVQSRKARQVARSFAVVQSVDSLRLARRLSRMAAEAQRSIEVLLEINVSGEASKYGFAGYNWQGDSSVLQALLEARREIEQLPMLRLRGLMTMAPFGAGEVARSRKVFADLYALREAMEAAGGERLPELSMGMTDDFEWAIAEGATVVRVGRAIFGDRMQKASK